MKTVEQWKELFNTTKTLTLPQFISAIQQDAIDECAAEIKKHFERMGMGMTAEMASDIMLALKSK